MAIGGFMRTKVFLFLGLFLISASLIALAGDEDLIPQAMKWKYGANVATDKEGNISIWESKFNANPGKVKVMKDVEDYKEYLANSEASKTSKIDGIKNELKALNLSDVAINYVLRLEE